MPVAVCINSNRKIGKYKTVFIFITGDTVVIGEDIYHPLVISDLPEKFKIPKVGDHYGLCGLRSTGL